MSLKELMNQLSEVEAEAAINVDEVDPAVRVGAEGRQRQAKSEVGQLRKRYLADVIPHVFIVAVSGPGSEQFGKLSSDKFDTIALDYKSLPKELANRLVARRCGEIYGQNEHWMLLTELNGLKNKYDIVRMPAPVFSALSSYYNKNLHEAVELLLRETYQNTLSTHVLRAEIAAAALERRFYGTKLPVVLYNYDQELESGLDLTLLPRPVTLIDTTDDVTEESVKSALLKVKDLVGGSKKRKSAPKQDAEPEAESQENEDAGE